MADVPTTGTGNPWIDMNLRILGTANNVFSSATDNHCGVIPNALTDTGGLYPGETRRGQVCVSRRCGAAHRAQRIVETSFSRDGL